MALVGTLLEIPDDMERDGIRTGHLLGLRLQLHSFVYRLRFYPYIVGTTTTWSYRQLNSLSFT